MIKKIDYTISININKFTNTFTNNKNNKSNLLNGFFN